MSCRESFWGSGVCQGTGFGFVGVFLFRSWVSCRDFEYYGIKGLGFSCRFAGLGFFFGRGGERGGGGGARVWGLVAEGHLYPQSVHVCGDVQTPELTSSLHEL